MIPKGEHEVVFEFKPNSFYVGNKIALSSSIIFLITFYSFSLLFKTGTIKQYIFKV